MNSGGEWLTFRELSLATEIGWNKLRWLRDSGVLTDLGMILYQSKRHIRSRWWVYVPSSVICQKPLHFLPSRDDHRPRNVPKT